MKNQTKQLIFFALGLIISILPVIAATIAYFPLWIQKGNGATLSGLALILILIAATPIFKLLRAKLASAAIWCVWLTIFIAFFALSKIANEMTVISFIGFISNALGAILFKISQRYKERDS